MRAPQIKIINMKAALRHLSLRRLARIPKARFRRAGRHILIGAVIAVIAIAFINIAVVITTSIDIMTPEAAAAWVQRDGGKADAVLVLGAAVWGETPSPILADRLDAGMRVFGAGASNLMLLSGDNGSVWYNEVQAMQSYVLQNGGVYGITKSNIYLDYAGFSTYDSIYRFKHVFQGERVVIVTQRYHLYRALFSAKLLGIDAVGVAAPDRADGQIPRDLREIPARVKDFFLALFRFPPHTLGEPVPLVYPSTQAASK